jgi:hypothetical protein
MALSRLWQRRDHFLILQDWRSYRNQIVKGRVGASLYPKRERERQQSVTTETISWEEVTPVSGKLELTIKLNTLPQVLKANGDCHFKVDCNGRMVQISVKQKQWSNWRQRVPLTRRVAAIAGQMGRLHQTALSWSNQTSRCLNERCARVRHPKGGEQKLPSIVFTGA